MENLIKLLVSLPVLFFRALNGGKDNAACAIASLILLLVLPIFIGFLLGNRKFIRVALFFQVMLLAVIFMIYSQWVIVALIAAGITGYITAKNFQVKCPENIRREKWEKLS